MTELSEGCLSNSQSVCKCVLRFVNVYRTLQICIQNLCVHDHIKKMLLIGISKCVDKSVNAFLRLFFLAVFFMFYST